MIARFLLVSALNIFFIAAGLPGQQDIKDDNISEVMNSQVQDIIWDVQMSINLSEGTGAEFDGYFFYVTNGLSNLISKYDTAGVLIETFSIPGVSNLSDIAFDGTFMYGGTGSPIIYQMDFVTKTLVNTISSPFNVEQIAYDEDNDAFWVHSWLDPLVLITRSGTVLNIFSMPIPSITGMAYDNVSPGEPYLWIFDRGSTIPGPQLIHQLHIPSGIFTGITHDVLSDVGAGQPDAVAGGLFLTSDLVDGTFSLGGILIGAPTVLFAYEIFNSIPVELAAFTANYSNGKIKLLWQTVTELNNKGFEIQKKQDLLENDWEIIDFVSGYGTTTQPRRYHIFDDQIQTGNYLYRLKQIDFDGAFSFSDVIKVTVPAPESFILDQNYPNPFNPSTQIIFVIPQDDERGKKNVTLIVYDVLGNEIATLVNEEKTVGEYEVEFNGIDLTSGIYFYQLKAGSLIETKKMVLLR